MGKFADSFGGKMLAGAGGSLLNGLFNIGAAKRQYKYQSKLQQQQYELNEQAAESAFARQQQFYTQQRDDQREWEDPSAVRARYENAGLNPNSAFGVAGSYTPQQSPSGSVGSQQGVGLGTASAFPVTDPIEQAYRLAMIRNVDAQTEKTQSETGDREEFLRGQRLANDLKDAGLISQNLANSLDALNLQFKNEVYDTEVAIRKQTADNMAKQYEQMNQQILESASKQRLNNEQIKQVASVIALNEANAYLARTKAEWHGKVSQAQIDKYLADVANIDSLIRLTDQRLETEKENTELVRFSKMLRGQEADVHNSKAGAFIREVGSIIKALSPFGK